MDHTRIAQIAAGELVEVDPVLAGEAGIRLPVAISRAAWADCVEWTEAIEAGKSAWTGQDQTGRLWDVLWMGAGAMRRAIAAADRLVGTGAAPRWTTFELYRVPASGAAAVEARLTRLAIRCGPDDDARPVLTITTTTEAAGTHTHARTPTRPYQRNPQPPATPHTPNHTKTVCPPNRGKLVQERRGGQHTMSERMITLWRDNRLDGEWAINVQDLAGRFAASPLGAGHQWPLERRIRAFVTDQDGLASVHAEEDFDVIEAACFNALHERAAARGKSVPPGTMTGSQPKGAQ